MQEDLTEITNMCEEELRAIRGAKLMTIKRAWDDLFFIGIAPSLYKEHPNDMTYKAFEDKLRKRVEVLWEDRDSRLSEIISEAEMEDDDLYIFIKKYEKEDQFDQMDMLLSLDYIPPHDWRGVALHLLVLINYYRFNLFIPSIEMRLDLSLCKLTGEVGKLSVISGLNGGGLEIVKKRNKTLRKRAGDKKTYVSQIFYSLTFEKGMKLHPIAILIRDEFIECQKRGLIEINLKTPNLTMIKEYMKQDKGIMKHFKQKGKFWII